MERIYFFENNVRDIGFFRFLERNKKKSDISKREELSVCHDKGFLKNEVSGHFFISTIKETGYTVFLQFLLIFLGISGLCRLSMRKEFGNKFNFKVLVSKGSFIYSKYVSAVLFLLMRRRSFGVFSWPVKFEERGVRIGTSSVSELGVRFFDYDFKEFKGQIEFKSEWGGSYGMGSFSTMVSKYLML